MISVALRRLMYLDLAYPFSALLTVSTTLAYKQRYLLCMLSFVYSLHLLKGGSDIAETQTSEVSKLNKVVREIHSP